MIRTLVLTGAAVALAGACTSPAARTSPPSTTPAGATAPAAGELAAGATVRIVDIGPDDVYAGAATRLLGRICELAAPATPGDAYQAVELRCDGEALAMAQVKLAPATPVVRFADAILPPGTAVIIVDVDAADALHDARPRLVGARCTADDELVLMDGAYAGTVTCDGQTLSFMAVTLGRP